jgi:hypothetical protein
LPVEPRSSPQEPFRQQQAHYDGASFDLSHLKLLDRALITASGQNVPLRFRFSDHGCTDKPASFRFIVEQTRRSGKLWVPP